MIKLADNSANSSAILYLIYYHPTVGYVEFNPKDGFTTYAKNRQQTWKHKTADEALEWLWSLLAVNRVLIPLCGKYHLRVDCVVSENKAKYFNITLVSNDKRKNTCDQDHHYNFLGGYWYTPEYKASAQVLRKMRSAVVVSLVDALRKFNKAEHPVRFSGNDTHAILL